MDLGGGGAVIGAVGTVGAVLSTVIGAVGTVGAVLSTVI
jgi:hypothetical protein